MVLTVLHILFGVLALIGLTSVICGVVRRRDDLPDDERYLLVILKGEDADHRLRAAASAVAQGRCRIRGGVIAIDAGMEEEAKRACRMIADDVGGVAVCSLKEFQSWLGGVAGEPNV